MLRMPGATIPFPETNGGHLGGWGGGGGPVAPATHFPNCHRKRKGAGWGRPQHETPDRLVAPVAISRHISGPVPGMGLGVVPLTCEPPVCSLRGLGQSPALPFAECTKSSLSARPWRGALFACEWGPVFGLLRLRLVLRGSSCVAFLTGPWTVTRSFPHVACQGIIACWALGLVRFASFVCRWGPVVGLLGPRWVMGWAGFQLRGGSGSGSGSPGPSPGKAVSGSAALRVTQTAHHLPLGGCAHCAWGPGCAVGCCRCGCGVRWHRVLGCGSGVASSVWGGGGCSRALRPWGSPLARPRSDHPDPPPMGLPPLSFGTATSRDTYEGTERHRSIELRHGVIMVRRQDPSQPRRHYMPHGRRSGVTPTSTDAMLILRECMISTSGRRHVSRLNKGGRPLLGGSRFIRRGSITRRGGVPLPQTSIIIVPRGLLVFALGGEYH